MGDMGGSYNQHGLKPPLKRYGSVLWIPPVQDSFNKVYLSFEVVGTRFLNRFLYNLSFSIPVTYGIMSIKIDKPFKKTVGALNSHLFLRGLSNYILGDVSHETSLGLDIQQTNPVIFNNAICHHIHCGGYLNDPSSVNKMGKPLPDVYGMRMLPTSSTSTFRKTEVGILGAAKPWMGGENTAPMFPETGADSDGIANRVFCKNPGRTPGILGQGMVITDRNECPSGFFKVDNPLDLLERGRAQRLLNKQYFRWVVFQHPDCHTNVGVRRGAYDDHVKTLTRDHIRP